MKYVIRKVPSRDTSYLERLLPKDRTIIVSDTERHGAVWSFKEALRRADDDAVYVQDDMILCRDFAFRAEQVIAEHPSSVIVFANFVHGSGRENTAFEPGFYSPYRASWLLCTYIPRRLAAMFLEQNENGIWKIRASHIKHDYDDVDWGDWLNSVGEEVYLTVPNLAGHPANTSEIEAKRPSRLCWNFDYLICEPGHPDLDKTVKVFLRYRDTYDKVRQEWLLDGCKHGFERSKYDRMKSNAVRNKKGAGAKHRVSGTASSGRIGGK